jgi:hypothetical protein
MTSFDGCGESRPSCGDRLRWLAPMALQTLNNVLMRQWCVAPPLPRHAKNARARDPGRGSLVCLSVSHLLRGGLQHAVAPATGAVDVRTVCERECAS